MSQRLLRSPHNGFEHYDQRPELPGQQPHARRVFRPRSEQRQHRDAAAENTDYRTDHRDRHGVAAGDIDLRLAYRGQIAGEIVPAGVSVAFANTTPGATDPTLTSALANLADTSYRFIVSPFSGSGQLTSLASYLSDTTGTWSPLTNNGGHVFTAYKGTFSAISTYGITNNNQHVSCLGLYDTPTSVSQMAGSFAGVCAASLRIDPSLPLKEIIMQGILAPPVQSRFTRTMRNTLLYAGIATSKSNPASQVILERAVTTYQLNGLGVPDDSYLQTETLYQLQAVIDLWKAAFSSKYARVKLVDNGTPIIPGSNMVNPNSIKSEVIAQYQVAANLGYVQGVAAFAQNVNVQKTSPYNVNIYAPIQLADQLFTIGVDLAFSK
jgi:phage tail sheath gpL-like